MRYLTLGFLLTACASSRVPKADEPEIPRPPPASATAESSDTPPPSSQPAPSSQQPTAGRDEGQSCGGIAGLMCKPGLRCVGNPMMCDPHRGGRDCGGVCQKASAPPADAGMGGPVCGSKRCPVGQVCCNSSCSICSPPGGLCTQQLCMPKPAP